jgi:hypothetical protein
MPIEINSIEYQCWHEVGHATACLHFGGSVEFIELLDSSSANGLARARCRTTPEIRPMVACGGFAVEFFLFRKGRLSLIEEQEMTQVIFRNATKDREIYSGKALSKDDHFTKQEDEKFMGFAISKVTPIFDLYLNEGGNSI